MIKVGLVPLTVPADGEEPSPQSMKALSWPGLVAFGSLTVATCPLNGTPAVAVMFRPVTAMPWGVASLIVAACAGADVIPDSPVQVRSMKESKAAPHFRGPFRRSINIVHVPFPA